MSEYLVIVMQYLSSTFGFAGTVLIYFYGVPRQIDNQGKFYLVLEENDPQEIDKIKRFKFWGNFGLLLIALSFVLNFFVIYGS